jgi:hypothetical protein
LLKLQFLVSFRILSNFWSIKCLVQIVNFTHWGFLWEDGSFTFYDLLCGVWTCVKGCYFFRSYTQTIRIMSSLIHKFLKIHSLAYSALSTQANHWTAGSSHPTGHSINSSSHAKVLIVDHLIDINQLILSTKQLICLHWIILTARVTVVFHMMRRWRISYNDCLVWLSDLKWKICWILWRILSSTIWLRRILFVLIIISIMHGHSGILHSLIMSFSKVYWGLP